MPDPVSAADFARTSAPDSVPDLAPVAKPATGPGILLRLCVAPSAIHGYGLFAAEDIEAGEVIGWCEAVPADPPGPHTLWCDSGPVDVVCDLRFTNHSSTPNVVYYDTLRVVALRDIKDGEELTYDYGPDFQKEGR